jgi:hypothetical protein
MSETNRRQNTKFIPESYDRNAQGTAARLTDNSTYTRSSACHCHRGGDSRKHEQKSDCVNICIMWERPVARVYARMVDEKEVREEDRLIHRDDASGKYAYCRNIRW